MSVNDIGSLTGQIQSQERRLTIVSRMSRAAKQHTAGPLANIRANVNVGLYTDCLITTGSHLIIARWREGRNYSRIYIYTRNHSITQSSDVMNLVNATFQRSFRTFRPPSIRCGDSSVKITQFEGRRKEIFRLLVAPFEKKEARVEKQLESSFRE